MNNKNNDNKNCIHCDAANCTYNDGKYNCTAGEIKVGTPDACNCGETFCSTFEMDPIDPPKHTF